MNNLTTFFALFLFTLSSCAQNNVKLTATSSKDTIALGETVIIGLHLEGIKADFLSQQDADKQSIFDNFFSDGPSKANAFGTQIRVTPKELGKNTLGPYQIQLLDKEIVSNIVSIHVIKQEPEMLYVKMPQTGKVGDKITISTSCQSTANFTIGLKENDFIKRGSQSHNTSITNGNYSRKAEFTVTLLKKGRFELTRDQFSDLPEHIIVEETSIEIN